jgi:hypothetical protein
MAAATRLFQLFWVNTGARVILGQHLMPGMAGITLRTGAAGRSLPMSVFLLVTAAAIHRTRPWRRLVGFVFHQGVTFLAIGLLGVDGRIKFIDGDMKFTIGTTYLMAINAFLVCIGKGYLSCREYQNN